MYRKFINVPIFSHFCPYFWNVRIGMYALWQLHLHVNVVCQMRSLCKKSIFQTLAFASMYFDYTWIGKIIYFKVSQIL